MEIYKIITTMVIRPLDDPPHDVLNLWSPNVRVGDELIR